MVEGCDCARFTYSSQLTGAQLTNALAYAAQVDAQIECDIDVPKVKTHREVVGGPHREPAPTKATKVAKR